MCKEIIMGLGLMVRDILKAEGIIAKIILFMIFWWFLSIAVFAIVLVAAFDLLLFIVGKIGDKFLVKIEEKKAQKEEIERQRNKIKYYVKLTDHTNNTENIIDTIWVADDYTTIDYLWDHNDLYDINGGYDFQITFVND